MSNVAIEQKQASTLKQDLNRYYVRGEAEGVFSYWKNLLKQAYLHPGLLAVVVYRYGQSCSKNNVPILRQALSLIYFVLYTFVRFLLHIELPRKTQIGPGLRIDHYGGILVNSGAVIGSNFTLTQGVLIGETEKGVPVIGSDVHCGVGCKIIGGITLGDCIKIGTGAILTKSFDGHAVIAGIPAKVLRKLETPPRSDGWIPAAEENRESAL